jgi:hypothetical protein
MLNLPTGACPKRTRTVTRATPYVPPAWPGRVDIPSDYNLRTTPKVRPSTLSVLLEMVIEAHKCAALFSRVQHIVVLFSFLGFHSARLFTRACHTLRPCYVPPPWRGTTQAYTSAGPYLGIILDLFRSSLVCSARFYLRSPAWGCQYAHIHLVTPCSSRRCSPRESHSHHQSHHVITQSFFFRS